MDEDKKIELDNLKSRIDDIYDDISKLKQIQREREEEYENECYEIKKMLDAGLFSDELNSNALQVMMHDIKMKAIELDYDIEEINTRFMKQIDELEEKSLEMEENDNARGN